MTKYYLIFTSILVTIVLLYSNILKVSSFSMEPTIKQGDILIVDGISLSFLPPIRGELIVYKDPRIQSHPFVIKRIVGMPGEDVYIINDMVSVVRNGATTTFPVDSLLGRKENGKDFHIYLGPEDYLLLGDNRAGSRDGRESGSIQVSEMYGRPFLKIWPISFFTHFLF